MSNFPSLIDFWRLKRHQSRTTCTVCPFHEQIAYELTRLVLGTLPQPNLMILMPPRCAKTDLGVRAFVPWCHSFFPDSESIITSYSADLATDNNIDIRNTFGADWYRQIVRSDWGATVKMRGEGAGGRQDYFHTEEGGSVKSVGTGGGITGFGAGKLRTEFGGAIVIDDPLKAQDARSPAMRETAINHIENTLKSRRNRMGGTPMVLIMQRLCPMDPAGWLLQNEREAWHVLQVPALDDKEQSIWEERLPTKSLLEMREANPDLFWSQYQQEPSESALTIFKRTWWKYWQDSATMERRLTFKIITADTAFKAKDSADWSVFQCWGLEGTSGMYLIDQLRGKWEFPELIKHAKEFWGKHTVPTTDITPASEFWIEDKASGISLQQTLRRDAGIPARAWEPNDKTSPDKVGRANQSTMPIAAGRIYLPDPSLPEYKWVNGFINEHEAFTTDDSHLNDDMVDTHTMASLIWQQRGGARGPVPIW